MLALLVTLLFFPLHERRVEIPDRPYSVWTFEDGGAADLAAILGDDVITVLAPGHDRAGYALWAEGGVVQVGRFNWYLLAVARMSPYAEDNDGRAYAAGVVPPLADTLEWGLSVFDALDLPRPTTSWEPGFPLESRTWEAWIAHLRLDAADHYDRAVEAEISQQMATPGH